MTVLILLLLALPALATAACPIPRPPWHAYAPRVAISSSVTGGETAPRLAVIWSPSDLTRVQAEWATSIRPIVKLLAELRARLWELEQIRRRAELGLESGISVIHAAASAMQILYELEGLAMSDARLRQWLECETRRARAELARYETLHTTPDGPPLGDRHPPGGGPDTSSRL
ncbi:MAG: hypothetical protein Q9O62_11980 [Ardenticatenia bacterium]|nr:hypothetical protein [Ardenticatenia bacterium]